MDSFIEVHLFIIICEIFFVLAVIHMINQKRSPTSMMAWLISMLLIPYIAVPFYFIFGSRKIKTKYSKSHVVLPCITQNKCEKPNSTNMLLINNGVQPVCSNNSFELITDGVEAYLKIIDELNLATHSIYISTYVFKDDQMTQTLVSILEKKAEDGLDIKLLIDSIGSWKLYFSRRKIFSSLKKRGGNIEFFMPIFQMPFRNYINLRNHRKVYLIDQKIVFTGGMNLAEEYLGPDKAVDRWSDLLFKIEGGSVCHLYNLFAQDWEYASKSKITHISSTHKEYGNIELQIVPSGPDIPSDALYESILNLIYLAKKRIWIVTPYFIPSEALMKALIIAHRKNVDVQLITPKHSNHLIADLARSGYMTMLYDEGIKIALYEGEMLHAKAIIFDDEASMLGSVNIDNRSLFLNYEVATYAYSDEVIQQISQWMNDLLANSSYNMRPKTKLRKFGENIMKITAPLL
jgi:cardiolipin synthase A/B